MLSNLTVRCRPPYTIVCGVVSHSVLLVVPQARPRTHLRFPKSPAEDASEHSRRERAADDPPKTIVSGEFASPVIVRPPLTFAGICFRQTFPAFR